MSVASVTNTFSAFTKAVAAQVNTNFSDIVSFLNDDVLHRDGSKSLTADLDMDSNNIVNLADPTAAQHAVSRNYLKQYIEICTSATRPSHSEGLHIYETDTDTILVSKGAAWEIIAEPPQTWTPTVSQGGTVTGTVNYGWYQRLYGTFTGRASWTSTGAGSGGNAISVTTPVTVTNTVDPWGTMVYNDGGTVYNTHITASGGQTAVLFYSTTQSVTNVFGVEQAITIASGDTIQIGMTGRYA